MPGKELYAFHSTTRVFRFCRVTLVASPSNVNGKTAKQKKIVLFSVVSKIIFVILIELTTKATSGPPTTAHHAPSLNTDSATIERGVESKVLLSRTFWSLRPEGVSGRCVGSRVDSRRRSLLPEHLLTLHHTGIAPAPIPYNDLLGFLA